MREDRKLVFVSHANPEDNEFALWLASRLTAMGYLVWSDITKLFGAEILWDDIEDAIRNHAAKVVVVLSRKAQQKDGVLDEINLAVSVERKHGVNRFVVPVRIDDLPFSDIKPNLGRKNVIDFEGNWAQGLAYLLKVLERDKVQRVNALSARNMSTWIENILMRSVKIVAQRQTVLSNWFQIKTLPEKLNFLMVPIPNEKLWTSFETFTYPVYPYEGMLATFADEGEVSEFLPPWQVATTAHRIVLAAILNGKPHGLPQMEWSEASNMLSFLIRRAWDLSMGARKLRSYEMSNGGKVWFPQVGYSRDGWTRYFDPNGVERRKRLVGRSEKRNIFWHFGMEAWPLIGRELRIVLKPHVVFTENGEAQFPSFRRMHQLRRGFCRSWWNSRWRDLMLSYLTLITDESGAIRIRGSSKQVFVVDPKPIHFQTSVSLMDASESSNEEDETDNRLDQLSDNLEWVDGDQFDGDIVEESEPQDHEGEGSPG